jgi:transcription initiation factor TFIIIB Brf1 subunit/transcription initiation factor TFIIB
MKIANRTINQRAGERGECPYCTSTEYSRDFKDIEDDWVRYQCDCICGKRFAEIFELVEQEWQT